jgi:hypothetical protein
MLPILDSKAKESILDFSMTSSCKFPVINSPNFYLIGILSALGYTINISI